MPAVYRTHRQIASINRHQPADIFGNHLGRECRWPRGAAHWRPRGSYSATTPVWSRPTEISVRHWRSSRPSGARGRNGAMRGRSRASTEGPAIRTLGLLRLPAVRGSTRPIAPSAWWRAQLRQRRGRRVTSAATAGRPWDQILAAASCPYTGRPSNTAARSRVPGTRQR
jgi:hypothetical protein